MDGRKISPANWPHGIEFLSFRNAKMKKATISKMSTLKNTGFLYFLLTQQFFWYFYPQYLMNSNSKTYSPYHFWKNSVRSFFAAICKKYKKWAIFEILVTITLGVNMITGKMTPFFSSALRASPSLVYFISAFPGLQFHEVPHCIIFWSVKYILPCKRWNFQAC